MKQRLQKIIADAGIASRRKAEELMEQGLVTVNGVVVDELGAKADAAEDEIRVDGQKIRVSAHKEVWMFYKPKSVVSTLDDPEGRPSLKDYLPHTKLRLFPVGRLDYDAEGLILLTNDGELSQALTHPSKDIWKEYLVKLKGRIPQEVMAKLRRGPIIDGKKKKPVRMKLIHHRDEKSWVSVSLTEGTKHHLKKMFLAVSYPVLKIKRLAIGDLILGELEPGKSRRLTVEEVDALWELTKKAKSNKGNKGNKVS